jgi:hypothetical protein
MQNVGLQEDVRTMAPLFASGVDNTTTEPPILRCIAAARLAIILLAILVTMQALQPRGTTAVRRRPPRAFHRYHHRTTCIKNVGMVEDVRTMEPLFATGVESMVAQRCIAAVRLTRILLAITVTMQALHQNRPTAV